MMRTDNDSLLNLVKEARRKNKLSSTPKDKDDLDELLWSIEFFIGKTVALANTNTTGKLLTINKTGEHYVTKHHS